MEHPGAQPDRTRHPSPTQEWLAAGTCLCGALFTLLIAPAAGMAQHPPVVFPSWGVVALMAAGSVTLSLWCSARLTTRPVTRGMLSSAILLGLLAASVPLHSYYASFHDYPWVCLVPALLALFAGCWKSNQRWLSGALLLLIPFWFHGSATGPAIQKLPVRQSDGDITVTIEELSRDQKVLFCNFRIECAPGTALDRYDLESITLEGAIPPGLPVRCWPPHVWESEATRTSALLSAYTFPPSWTRSFNLTVTVPAWPPKPAVSVNIPVPRPGAPSAARCTGEGGGMRVEIRNVRWSRSSTTIPAPRCLAMQIHYSGQSDFEGAGQALRATDDQGRNLPIRTWSSMSDDSGTTLESEVWPISPGVKSIRIDGFSAAQLAENQKVFRFRGLPNRTVN